jgi:5'-3' exoribonuclease 1
MGIPSYFSYIVKNHANIIKKLSSNTIRVDNLYMDCNSIIYDILHNIDFSTIKEDEADAIIKAVCYKIDEYIDILKPKKNIYIAFDGVAPVAKLDQQRTRRYKSIYQSGITQAMQNDNKSDPWNTTAITPGTLFMQKLNTKINYYFKDSSLSYNVEDIIISGSNICGEGEHKLFQYIRSFPEKHVSFNTVIYGLDADLIMLSINHLPITNNIYLFRETPHFIKSINAELEPNETYVIDIPELANIITLDMNNGEKEVNKNRIYDYIFLCFFLGNDFMPHFPAINIRTGGVDKMLQAYKETIDCCIPSSISSRFW